MVAQASRHAAVAHAVAVVAAQVCAGVALLAPCWGRLMGALSVQRLQDARGLGVAVRGR